METITPKIEYTTEQLEVIKKRISNLDTCNGFIEYFWSDKIIQRGPQGFACFGPTSREFYTTQTGNSPFETQLLLDFQEEYAIEYLPVIIDGKCLEECPEEGRSGMAYLFRMLVRSGKPITNPEWSVCFLSTGWLYTRELEWTNQQIEDQIVDEIESGENVLTHKPAGWM